MFRIYCESFFTHLLGSALLGLVFSAPALEVEKEKLPDLAGESNWGTITQDGRRLTITGNAHWDAVGEIRKDGSVFLTWFLIDSEEGRTAPSVYKIDGRDMVGQWGWQDNVVIQEDGSIVGRLNADTIRRKLP